MATVYVTFAQPDSLPILAGSSGRSETITSSGTTASGALTANSGDVVQVFCATTVIARAGATPTAALATGIVCPAGVPTFLRVQLYDKIAVIDA